MHSVIVDCFTFAWLASSKYAAFGLCVCVVVSCIYSIHLCVGLWEEFDYTLNYANFKVYIQRRGGTGQNIEQDETYMIVGVFAVWIYCKVLQQNANALHYPDDDDASILVFQSNL